jgi:hypothetical protein
VHYTYPADMCAAVLVSCVQTSHPPTCPTWPAHVSMNPLWVNNAVLYKEYIRPSGPLKVASACCACAAWSRLMLAMVASHTRREGGRMAHRCLCDLWNLRQKYWGFIRVRFDRSPAKKGRLSMIACCHRVITSCYVRACFPWANPGAILDFVEKSENTQLLFSLARCMKKCSRAGFTLSLCEEASWQSLVLKYEGV